MRVTVATVFKERSGLGIGTEKYIRIVFDGKGAVNQTATDFAQNLTDAGMYLTHNKQGSTHVIEVETGYFIATPYYATTAASVICKNLQAMAKKNLITYENAKDAMSFASSFISTEVSSRKFSTSYMRELDDYRNTKLCEIEPPESNNLSVQLLTATTLVGVLGLFKLKQRCTKRKPCSTPQPVLAPTDTSTGGPSLN